jgi:hypothetical protein
MAYTTADAQQELLETIADAIGQLGYALAALGEAYEQVDDATADRLEQQLFGPVQVAYGRLQRTHSEFAARHGLQGRSFETPSAGLPSTGARGFIEGAANAIAGADGVISTLQDSMAPVEVGDAELRAGLTDVRELIDRLPSRAHELVRGLGR